MALEPSRGVHDLSRALCGFVDAVGLESTFNEESLIAITPGWKTRNYEFLVNMLVLVCLRNSRCFDLEHVEPARRV
jgi:hypothetical protein